MTLQRLEGCWIWTLSQTVFQSFPAWFFPLTDALKQSFTVCFVTQMLLS